MKALVKFVFFALLVLFCWGWVSNVALGTMTTSQYIWKLRMHLRQFSIDLKEKITGESQKNAKAGNRIAGDVRTWYGSDPSRTWESSSTKGE